MDVTAYDIALIGGGFTVIGTLLSYWPSRWLMDKQNVAIASAKFRCSFTEEIRLVEESTAETDFIGLFNRAYVRHYNAVIQFLPYLCESERAEIKNAWDNHCYPQGNDEYERRIPSTRFIHYEHSQGIEIVNRKPRISEDHEASYRRAKNLVTKNLDSILAFAKFR
jgi:hypothetical protein